MLFLIVQIAILVQSAMNVAENVKHARPASVMTVSTVSHVIAAEG